MRRIYSTEAMWRASVRATGVTVTPAQYHAVSRFPYDHWRPHRTSAGKTVSEHRKGTPGHVAFCRMQVALALEDAARFRARRLSEVALAALEDAAAWRRREHAALERNAPSDRLWSGHRAFYLSDPTTWTRPWSPLRVDLGDGMALDAVIVR